MEFFLFSFYIAITEYLDFIAVLYLIGALLVLLSPVWAALKMISYVVIIGFTAMLLVDVIVTIFTTLRKALTAGWVIQQG